MEPEVDFQDEESLFQWLYPSANKTRSDYLTQTEEEGRGFTGRSFQNWLDYVMDVIQDECREEAQPDNDRKHEGT